MEAKNVDDHRAEKKQPQRDVSVCDQEQATDDLSQKYDGVEMRRENGSDELSRDAPKLVGRNKVQKTIQAENDEDQAKQVSETVLARITASIEILNKR